ncbi:MAG: hypothetical protein GY828_00520 [Candidatus Gracilibacteria bacterium]|nr:hypothetical protein [Candidatus Gracilibacteria bacterium]
MGTLQRNILAFLSLLLSIFFYNTSEVNAARFTGLETKITAESSEKKVKKLQKFFTELNLYSGKIDGKHSSVLPSLLSYQKQTGLIKNNTDWGAGYFGVQTLTAIKEDYPSQFEQYKFILEQEKPAEGERYFYVTAYYSPIKGQRRYTTGSFAGDVRLNGSGIRTASNKKVFSGLLAGPKNYSFGTKIELEGIGVGAVEDRGGAIVNAGERGFEHDRIDVWMGYGDEGLERALKWGKRKVKGKIVSDDIDVSIQFNNSVVAKYSTLYVKPDSSSVDIKKLQTLFTELKLYNGNIDGRYISIKDDVVDFQLKYDIIQKRNEDQAGYFGKKTYAKLKEYYGASDDIFHVPEKIIQQHIALTRKEKLQIKKLRNKFDSYLNKKLKGDKKKIKNYKSKMEIKINKIIKKSNNSKKKNKLQYFKSIL